MGISRKSTKWVAVLVTWVVAAAMVVGVAPSATAAQIGASEAAVQQTASVGIAAPALQQPVLAQPRAKTRIGSLQIKINNLPRTLSAKVRVTGSRNFVRTINSSKTLRVRAGRYRITAKQIRSGTWVYRPSITTVRRTIKRGKTSRISVRYRKYRVPASNNPGNNNPVNDDPVSPSPGPVQPPQIEQTNGGLSLGSYEIGSLNNIRDIWVSPTGNDSNSGSSSSNPLRTVAAAWNQIAQSAELDRPHRIQIRQGTYASGALPNYWENHWGTKSAPIILNSVDGVGKAIFTGDVNMYNSRYVYFDGINIVRDGDTVHCEKCSYLVFRNMKLDGDATPGGEGAHETVKINQSDHIYIENSDIGGADDNAIDFVAVQYGHVLNSKISRAQDWCAYAKGGSAYVTFGNNEVFDCGTGGITVGQGTGFEFMTPPWMYYEGTGVYVVNNVIHDTEGAALGVNGGYNVLLAYNTAYRVGTRSHAFEFVFGRRGCDGLVVDDEISIAACAARNAAGGWGSVSSEDSYIPNKHIYFYNNVLLNPNGVASPWGQFVIQGATAVPAELNVPTPSRADDDIRIAGNVIKNGADGLAINDGDGCQDSNPTCAEAIVRVNNAINSWMPTFVDAAGGNFTPTGQLATTSGVAIPDFSWSDVPGGIWEGGGQNSIPTTKTGAIRNGWGRPGAQ